MEARGPDAETKPRPRREDLIFDRLHQSCIGWLALLLMMTFGCAQNRERPNSLYQHTGDAGSSIPRTTPPKQPNTAGNILAPPGNPGGNQAGAPPIVGGTENQQGGWPAER